MFAGFSHSFAFARFGFARGEISSGRPLKTPVNQKRFHRSPLQKSYCASRKKKRSEENTERTTSLRKTTKGRRDIYWQKVEEHWNQHS